MSVASQKLTFLHNKKLRPDDHFDASVGFTYSVDQMEDPMKLSTRIFLFLCGLVLLSGCTESNDSRSPAEAAKKTPSPQFIQEVDPKVFFEKYLADLSAETFLPQNLASELNNQTQLSTAIALIERHHTLDFVTWYYSTAYLDQVRARIDKKMERMDYQLKILRIEPQQAAVVMLVTDAGPLEHLKALQQGTLTQQWRQKDDNSYDLRLSVGRWQQQLRVVREAGNWKLEVAAGSTMLPARD